MHSLPSLLCIVAHPDDEARLCGGVLALLSARGVAVHLVCLTRGEGGELGEPPLASRETLGAQREQEMVCAAGKLRVRSLTFLDYVDPVVGPDQTLFAPDVDLVTLAGQILNSIGQARAQVVLTHGSDGEYGHPGHRLVHQAALAAAMSQRENGPLLYSFGASFPQHPYPRLANPGDLAHFVVDVTPVLAQKVAASLCHMTQHDLFVRRRSAEAGRVLSVEEIVTVETLEGLRRQWPLVEGDGPPDDIMAEWLRGALWQEPA